MATLFLNFHTTHLLLITYYLLLITHGNVFGTLPSSIEVDGA